MTNNRIVIRIVFILAAALVAWFFFSQDEAQQTATQPTVQSKATPAPATAPEPLQAKADQLVEATEPEAIRDAVFALVHEGRARVECTVPEGIPDGVYRSRPSVRGGDASLLHPTVEQGVLRAAVTAPTGEDFMDYELQIVGVVTWSGAESGVSTCSVQQAPRVPISGLVKHADGSPAADALVRACDHGELIRTNEDGHFRMMAPLGSTCLPMAFDETDEGTFGKGSFQTVTVETTDPVTDIELMLPPREEYWDRDQRAKFATQLVKLNEMQVQMQHKKINSLKPFELVLKDSEAKALVQAWIANEELRAQQIEDQTLLLLDPDSQADALTEAFLNQY